MKKYLILLFIVFIAGCGNDSSKNNQSIVGIWETPACHETRLAPDEFVKYRFELYSNNTYHHEAYYYESNCNSDSDYKNVVIFDGTYSTYEKGIICSGETATFLVITLPDDDEEDEQITHEFAFLIDNNSLYIGDGTVAPIAGSEEEFCYNLSYDWYYKKIQ